MHITEIRAKSREIQIPSLKADVWKYFGFWSWRGKGVGQSRATL